MSPTPRDEGSASLEAAALLPVLAVVVTLLLQGAAALWTISAANSAARQAARAASLGQDPLAAAEGALLGGLRLEAVETYGPDSGVRIHVSVPRVSVLPRISISRSAEMP